MITQIINNSNRINIDWQLSNVCNFDCSYCPDNVKNGSSGWPSLKCCVDSVDIVVENGLCEFTFSGGELTLWKDFPQLCSYIKQKGNHKIYLITNGYRSPNYWKNINVDIIFFSWHPTSKLKIEKWCEKINLCTNKHKRIFVLMYPYVWDKAVSDFNYLKENLIDFETLELKYVDERAKKEKILYTQDQLSFIEKNAILNFKKATRAKFNVVINNIEKHIPISKILTKKLNKFYGWKCNAGIKNLVLQINGNVSSTSACNVGESLGNWHYSFFEFAKKPLICNIKNCWCAPDIMIEKWN